MPDLNHQRIVGARHGWHVYVAAEMSDESWCKIGTAQNLSYRLSGLRHGNPREVYFAAAWRLRSREDAFALERTILSQFRQQRIGGRDWIRMPASIIVGAVEDAALADGFLFDRVLP